MQERNFALGVAYSKTEVVQVALFAFVALGAEETQLHELVGPQDFVQLDKEGRREPALADLQRGIEFLAQAAEMGFLRAGEGQVIHGARVFAKLGPRQA